ncbi:class I mannose-6-phosphate isomerase [Alicyclobacillus fastidiosus]|uniref:Mannose-6-phosphate isomerase n=1 Tax=Alicyclobacillus fastidiosus TaxID=392011 RepID=A0ABY6ZNC1_9BACL|nr:type I phosphomannose isomerase catalytic subunit [Alicyclobacillus fastidiosus]WAH43601.1 class I mannose-6-phosphate isomerase [Alicyclobacillus fastidiosus]GMA59787.1 mannose-6-phosphate isomerase [Alicyclobacillus fastidiosus]
MYPVKFKPVPMHRIWGGDGLKPMFHVESTEPIGEYWVVSGHPHGMSVVSEGPLVGRTLNELTEMYPSAYLGKSPQPRFPLLIKFLEAEDDLSVQIHPDDTYAIANEGDFGKTEAWYVLDAKEDGKVNYGHSFPDRETYERAVQNGQVKDHLEYRSVRKGDLVFVPARTLHALLAGTKVLEIQQTSDVTYRVYDWDRVDDSGKGRALHVDKAADVLEYGQPLVDVERVWIHSEEGIEHQRLVECPYFTIESVVTSEPLALTHGHSGNPDVLIVVEGTGELRATVDGQQQSLSLNPGDAVLIPGTLEVYEVWPQSPLTVVRTYY